MRAVITSRRLEQKRLTWEKGTALIWASNLLHGGCPILQPGTTRLSQVTHYYFERCLYYTPILSNSVLGEYCLKDLLDVRSGRPLKHTINGEELDLYALPNGRHRVARKGSSRALGTLMPQPADPSPRSPRPPAPVAAPLAPRQPSVLPRPEDVRTPHRAAPDGEQQARAVDEDREADPLEKVQARAARSGGAGSLAPTARRATVTSHGRRCAGCSHRIAAGTSRSGEADVEQLRRRERRREEWLQAELTARRDAAEAGREPDPPARDRIERAAGARAQLGGGASRPGAGEAGSAGRAPPCANARASRPPRAAPRAARPPPRRRAAASPAGRACCACDARPRGRRRGLAARDSTTAARRPRPAGHLAGATGPPTARGWVRREHVLDAARAAAPARATSREPVPTPRAGVEQQQPAARA